MDWNGSERRRFPRIVFPCKVYVMSPSRMLTVSTENIGLGGIRVILDDELRYKDIVGLELFFEHREPIRCEGRIVWVVGKAKSSDDVRLAYDTGIEFISLSRQDKEYIRNLLYRFIDQEK